MVGGTGSRTGPIEEDEIIGKKIGKKSHIPHPALEVLTHMLLANNREMMIDYRKWIDCNQILMMHRQSIDRYT